MLEFYNRYRKWVVLGGLMLIYAASNGIIVHTLPLIYPALMDEFSWSAAQITLPATAFFVFGAVTSPPAGVLFDRLSPRLIMLSGAAGIIAGLAGYTFVTELWQLVAIYLVFGLSLSLCGLTASMVVLTKWFDGNRGLATGLLLMASSFGGAVFPLILGAGLESYGWRSAIMMVSVAAALITIPALLFFVLDKPRPEDATDVSILRRIKLKVLQPGPTLREAIRTPTFYLIAIATGCMWFSIVALLQHQSIHLVKDVGVTRSLLPKVFSVFFFCSVFGKFSFGWLSDFLNKEVAMILSIITFTLGLVIIRGMQADDTSMLFVYAVITGIGFSGAFTTIQLMIAQHYAGSSYGKILAILVMIDSLAGGIGTRIIAKMRDGADNYLPALDFMISVCFMALVSVILIRYLNPKAKTASTVQEL